MAQLFYDGNKRTARPIANAVRLSYGYDAIFIPAAEQLQFNLLLNDLFKTKNPNPLISYLTSRTLEPVTDEQKAKLTKSADTAAGLQLPSGSIRTLTQAAFPSPVNTGSTPAMLGQ